MFSQVGPMEIVLVLAIALIVLGPKRLPSAARSVGKGIREFKNSLSDADPRGMFDDEDEEPAHTTPARPAEKAEPVAATKPAPTAASKAPAAE
jgi:sec-independent protein translocase protein TatA